MELKIINDPVLVKIRDIIIKTISPEKIILFGSRARGDNGEESDYDILIIKNKIDNERILTRKVNYEIFNEKLTREIDIIATSTEKWEKNKNEIGLIYRTINSEGIVLYGK